MNYINKVRGKKAKIAAALGLSVAVVLSGCATPADEPAANETAATEEVATEISIMNRWSDPITLAVVEELFAAFTAETGIAIKNESLPVEGDTYATAVRAGLSSSTPPDIVVNIAGPSVAAFAEGGVLKDLTEFYSSELAARSSDGAIAGMKFEDKIYAISAGSAVGNLVYVNPEYLAQYGVDAAAVTTFEEWTAAMKKVKDAGGTPIVAGIKDQWPSGHYLNDVVQRALGSEAASTMYSRTVAAGAPDSPKWTDAAVVDAFEAYKSLTPLLQEGFAGESSDVAASIFTSGNAGYFKMGSWFLSTIVQTEPAFTPDVMLFPPFEDGAGDGSEVTLSNIAMMVSKDANWKAVQIFLEFFTRPDVAAKYGAGTSQVMPYKITSSLSVVEPIIKEQWDKISGFAANASAAALFNDQSLDVNFYQKHIWQGSVGMMTGQLSIADLTKNLEEDTAKLQE